MAARGFAYHAQEAITVLDAETMEPVPWDSETMGEIMFRGNLVMKGYLKNPQGHRGVLRGGYYHTGDLAVMQPDGYVKIKDRSKDVIISGGENISSIEVEDVLYRHPAIMAAAVVAAPDEVGRGAMRVPRVARGVRERHGGGDETVLSRTPGRLQGTEAVHLQRAAENLDRQDPEVRSSRAGTLERLVRVKRHDGQLRHSMGAGSDTAQVPALADACQR